jgi:peptidoglycan/LPS O-acetylase OafA/YrhL
MQLAEASKFEVGAKASCECRNFFPAIQGMRALAVLSVVLAHAKVPGFGGGFVGVDVFFVISGFLICRLLFLEIERDGRLKIIEFWGRRVRRLLPNATLTLLAVLAIGLVFTPQFMRAELGVDVRMSALQVVNFHFAEKAVDYFRQDDPQSPVLHFWSLAVEEQFYIVWPAVLALLCALLRGSALALSRKLLFVIVAGSFIGMLYAVSFNQPVAFFHSWSRAWQLGVGGLLAVAYTVGIGLPGTRLGDSSVLRCVCQVIGWAGLAAILAAVCFLDESAIYPGWLALIPTLGAAGMIASVVLVQPATWSVATPLSCRLPLWLGARSYSWYLWHWPAITFAEFISPATLGIRSLGALVGLACAMLAYKYIEDPIRRSEYLAMPAGRTVLVGLTSILVLVAASAAFPHVSAFDHAASLERTARMKAAADDLGAVYVDKCHLDVPISVQPECEYGVVGSEKRAVLFGDSHAAQWFTAIRDASLQHNWSFRSWTKSSCPSIDVPIWYPPRKSGFRECTAWRESIMARLTGRDRPDVVFLSNLLSYPGWIEDPHRPGRLLGRSEAEALMKAGMMRVVQQLVEAGVLVVIIRDTPRMIRSLAFCYARDGGNVCDLARDRAQPPPWIDVEVAEAFARSRVKFLDLNDEICEPSVCRVERQGEVIWRDSHHIRASFAQRQSPHFSRVFTEIDVRMRK